MTISSRFSANYFYISHKTEVQTVICRCWTSLNLNWFKSYDTKHKYFHSRFFSDFVKKTNMCSVFCDFRIFCVFCVFSWQKTDFCQSQILGNRLYYIVYLFILVTNYRWCCLNLLVIKTVKWIYFYLSEDVNFNNRQLWMNMYWGRRLQKLSLSHFYSTKLNL